MVGHINSRGIYASGKIVEMAIKATLKTALNQSQPIEIESFAGRQAGEVRLRPIAGQAYPPSMAVEGNKSLLEDYPVGSRFRVQATVAERPTGGQFLKTSWQWDVVVHPPVE